MNAACIGRFFTGGIALVVATATSTLVAQQPFHVAALTTGASMMSVDAINVQLANAQFAGLSNDGVSYGASTYLAFGRAMLGADIGVSRFGEEGLNNGRSDKLDARQFLGTVSFAIVSERHLSVFPTLGVGVGSFDVTLSDRGATSTARAGTPTFAEVAANPGRSATIAGSHLLYSVGGGLDYLVTRGSGDVGIVLGLRAGVLLAPNRTTWSCAGYDVVAGPDASSQGPFLRFVVGVGGR